LTRTRLFFATDVHGSETCFLKFLNSAKPYNANPLILGGDLTGKTLVPIVKVKDGKYRADFLGTERVLNSEVEVRALERRINSIGSYSHMTDSDGLAELEADGPKLDALFSQLMVGRLRRWVSLAEERLRGTGIKLYITGGNDDFLIIDEVLRSSPVIIDPESTIVDIDGTHEMLGCAFTNPTPWKTPRELTEEELYEKLTALAHKVSNPSRCIFDIHAPPYASGLDTCQQIGEDFRPIFVHGQPAMTSAGSTAVCKIVEEVQPLLGLHGHIHESRGTASIGRTFCINPGSEYTEGILRGVIVNLEGERVRSHLFTSG
jgi:Icc-related predicted phosphoesterase